MFMHRIQNHIITQLINATDLRYADIKPAEIEGNLFMYHLKQLLKGGLVQKRADGRYELSPEGQLYADRLSLKTLAPRAQPRIVTLVACQNDTGEYLLYRRSRQPLIGMVGFPYGKIHLGETVAAAAVRELSEKTGLWAELSHRGDGYINIYNHGQPVSQILFHLFIGRNVSGQLLPKTKQGEAFWKNPKDLAAGELIPSVRELCRLMDENPGTRFFAELSYNLSNE
jgi:8-oxo-dGTP diphosphatase